MAVNQRSRSEPQALRSPTRRVRRRPSLALAGSGLALTPGVFRAIDAQASEGQLLRPLRHSEPREREHAVRDRLALARSLPRERVPVHLYQPRSRRRERRHRGDCDHDQNARIWDREIPLARRVPMAFVGVGAELRQYARAFRELKGTDMLIVPGTGLVTDAFGLLNWGPYSLFKWVLMAKLRRSRVLFVSIGAGPIDSILGRGLVKATLSLADYRSYRDDASRDYLRGIGFPAKRDRVYPDLVFGLPESLLSRDHARSEGTRRVVGLGLMVYHGKYSAGRSTS